MTYAEQAIDFLENSGDIQDVDFPDTHSIMESGLIDDCELIIFEDKSSIISGSEGWEVNPEVVSISDYT